jgi:hypothetical protein
MLHQASEGKRRGFLMIIFAGEYTQHLNNSGMGADKMFYLLDL